MAPSSNWPHCAIKLAVFATDMIGHIAILTTADFIRHPALRPDFTRFSDATAPENDRLSQHRTALGAPRQTTYTSGATESSIVSQGTVPTSSRKTRSAAARKERRMNRFSRQVGPRRLASKHSKTVGTTLGLTTVPHYSSESNRVGRILLCADGRMERGSTKRLRSC